MDAVDALTADDDRAYRERARRRAAFQAALDEALRPLDPAPAEAVRADWAPIRQLLREGPHVRDATPDDDTRRHRL